MTRRCEYRELIGIALPCRAFGRYFSTQAVARTPAQYQMLDIQMYKPHRGVGPSLWGFSDLTGSFDGARRLHRRSGLQKQIIRTDLFTMELAYTDRPQVTLIKRRADGIHASVMSCTGVAPFNSRG